MTRRLRPCRRCKHARALHEHYRPGTDCASCMCPAYRSRWQDLFTGLLGR